MFLIGVLMGIGVVFVGGKDHISESLHLWINIDSEVLLLVFLPGLIFKDAHGLNVHLFRAALPQCLIFAFPMVLAGTALTACIAYYIFPYDWSFDLAMTFGAILSATDPVAVAALLEEVGAPPRLKVHIGGEALLNDGAAIVFFFIFLARFLFEINIDGGEDVTWGKGFEMFFRMSLGGVAIGLAFGYGLIMILYLLDRRYNREENVVQVTATMAVAYTGFYVAEVVCKTSGVIATVVCGIVVKFFASSMINDTQLLDDFWTLVEHLLNTVLFVLGGVVWGSVVAEGERDRIWTAVDWGYLLLLYVLLTVIRFVLFTLAYPITSRIGLKTDVKETIFQVYGGLRGAVGIALAIALDNAVTSRLPEDSIYAVQTAHLFAMVGGIAFLTLVINGTTAGMSGNSDSIFLLSLNNVGGLTIYSISFVRCPLGPILKKMGLADSTETRKKMIDAYQAGLKRSTVDDMVRLLSKRLFRNVNFALVKHHVPYLKELTRAQLCEAVLKHRETTAEEDYGPPYLDRILPYLPSDDVDVDEGGGEDDDNANSNGSFSKYCQKDANGAVCWAKPDDILNSLDPDAHYKKKQRERRTKNRKKNLGRRSSLHHLMNAEPMSAQEFRQLFISILQSAYQQQVQRGELLSRRDFLFIALHESLEFAADACAKGKPLMDWHFVNILKSPAWPKEGEQNKFFGFFAPKKGSGRENYMKRFQITRAIAFVSAHRWAQNFFRREFENAERELSEGGKIVLEESEKQIDEAELELAQFNPEDVEHVVSHMFCSILLNSGAHYVYVPLLLPCTFIVVLIF